MNTNKKSNKKAISLSNKEIDFKSLLIGFLLAAVLFLGLGAYSGGGTQDVRIVGISTYDNLEVTVDRITTSNKMPVEIKSSSNIPVKVTDIKSTLNLPVKINEIGYNIKVPVSIANQPIQVTRK